MHVFRYIYVAEVIVDCVAGDGEHESLHAFGIEGLVAFKHLHPHIVCQIFCIGHAVHALRDEAQQGG